jgi:16S rRNA (cytosine967-C5)-methyltransferase
MADKTRGRQRPHPRTHHDLDPRRAGFETLRRLKPGDLLEPAAIATLRYLGFGPEYAHRVLPMLEDATRFSILFDHLISHLATRAPDTLDADVRAALHLFLAWYLLDSPNAAYAHGNAAVEMLTPDHKGRGFVNALVRKLGTFVKVETETLTGSDWLGRLNTSRASLGAGRVLTAERPIFPDPAKDLAAHLSIVGSVPRFLIDRLLDQHGPEAAAQVALSSVERPLTWIRPNPMASNSTELASWWTGRGVDVERVELPGQRAALALPAKTPDLTQHPSWGLGGFYVQDYSAQLVAPLLQPQAGEMLLDLCSAPGGKAGHLAELTRDKARILACDQSEAKLELIQQNIARMGYGSIATVVADATEVKFPEKFDRILIDAPCSNSGVLARRVEARHRINDMALKDLKALQVKILTNAAANLKPGGVIVYSVCSVLMEEGPDVVHKFMKTAGDGWEIEDEVYTLPIPARHDGGYACRLHTPE